MNTKVREQVRQVLEQRGMTQSELARRVGVKRMNLNRLLSERGSEIPRTWQKVLDELKLELVIQPRQDNG